MLRSSRGWVQITLQCHAVRYSFRVVGVSEIDEPLQSTVFSVYRPANSIRIQGV
jgi:predicted transcriptional regulator